METKVSVIIPVYNTEEYLGNCLTSICTQTLEDLEIICINDASEDNSLNILNDFANKDKRIKVINFRLNKGAAQARNYGIEIAKGEFISFIDSDDYLETADFYEKLYNKAIQTNADITKGLYKNSSDNTVFKEINNKIKENKNNFCSTYCSAIFRRSLLINNNITFPEIIDMEDPVFAFEAALHANKIEIVEDLYIVITQRDNSLTRRQLCFQQLKDKIKGMEILLHLANSNSITPEVYSYVLGYWFVTIIQDVLNKNNSRIFSEYLFCKMAGIFRNFKFNVDINATFYNFFNKNLSEFYYFDKEELKKIIDTKDIISFDIFDTLLLRPFLAPSDVFKYMEQQYNIPNFALTRLVSEKKVRMVKAIRDRRIEDITIDEIYSKLDKNLRDKEMEIEAQILQCNEEILEIYNYALEQGKQIIITSDMYLPTNFLAQVLNDKGFKNFSKLSVSGEIGKCKATGNLYKFIIQDLNISPDKILHIGDNKISDIEKAKENSIEAFYYKNIFERFKISKINNYAFEYFDNYAIDKISSSSIIALSAINWINQNDKSNYWKDLGYNIGGPLALSVVTSIFTIAKQRNLSDIFFVARDGYMLKLAYDLIKPENAPKSHYIYASRRMKNLCINDNPIFSEITKNNYQKYAASIKLSGENIGIVDTCAGNFSAQTLIEKFFSAKSFLGIYIASTLNYKYNYINLSIKPHSNKAIGFSWDLIEFLFTSNEAPVEDMKNEKPEYRKLLNDNDFFRLSLFPFISEGILNFVKDYTKIFGIQSFNFDADQVFEYIKCFWQNMSFLDYYMLSQVKHPTDSAQQVYVSLTLADEERIKILNKKVGKKLELIHN